ncbi:outer membrane protease [Rhizobium halophytocola]|uniref:Outer membrane protease n=1 Tax=Rhizobium halophytocola TaxID=735519 RepID=A0ABS4DYF3_9HYPH|nr:outer membrane protease [Rhizobium halophytocola]
MGLALYPLAAGVLVVSAQARAGDTVFASFDAGYSRLSAEESVNIDGFRLSELDWKSENVPTLRGALGINITPTWQIKAEGRIGFKGDGEMRDYDWIPPYYINTGDGGWSDRSVHPDTELDHYFSGGVEINHQLFEDGRNTLSAGIGGRYTDVQWTARGGSYVYSVSGTRDTVGEFADGEKAITYRQKMPAVYAQVDGTRTFGRFSLDGGVEVGALIKPKTIDDHWMRDLRITDEFDYAPMVAVNLTLNYALTHSASVYLAGSFDYTDFGDGDSTYVDRTAGTRTTAADIGGATFQAAYVGAGIKGSF